MSGGLGLPRAEAAAPRRQLAERLLTALENRVLTTEQFRKSREEIREEALDAVANFHADLARGGPDHSGSTFEIQDMYGKQVLTVAFAAPPKPSSI